ncbi:MAG TPA: hypothetical protein PLB21_14715, partial [Actinomycetota bacterium]|nr:hypothetical protein [Actinomycetota bacterium]
MAHWLLRAGSLAAAMVAAAVEVVAGDPKACMLRVSGSTERTPGDLCACATNTRAAVGLGALRVSTVSRPATVRVTA